MVPGDAHARKPLAQQRQLARRKAAEPQNSRPHPTTWTASGPSAKRHTRTEGPGPPPQPSYGYRRIGSGRSHLPPSPWGQLGLTTPATRWPVCPPQGDDPSSLARPAVDCPQETAGPLCPILWFSAFPRADSGPAQSGVTYDDGPPDLSCSYCPECPWLGRRFRPDCR
jgi:hypothetical protein